ncbi:MAG: heme-copper oxidase subunit III, partial [Bacteroidota bacterium]
KLNLWLFMLASCMLFAAFVSAYIVARPDAEAKQLWTSFDLPVYFFYSLLISILSSVSIQMATVAAKKDELSRNKVLIAVTLVLSVLFCYSQYLGWSRLVMQDLTFVNSRPEHISASYVWVITVLHFIHILGGIVLLVIAQVKSLRLEIHKKQITFMSITNTYWHFVGLLWFILYLFLYFAR